VAVVKGLLIFAYFVGTTVWLPSWVLELRVVAAATPLLRDLVGTGVWLVFMVGGVWWLRRLQASGWI